ncbi:MAG: DUF3037 domain-containing protein [Pyrinomonadaceae bacterium]
MPELYKYDYAVIRLVPRVEREEFINVGVIISCPARDFLRAQIAINEKRLIAFAPQFKIEELCDYLDTFTKICAGDEKAGVIGDLTKRERFYWLTSVRSTIIQTSPVHSGLCADPENELRKLMKKMVFLSDK